MERLLTRGDMPVFMLTVQHRSSPQIMNFPSQNFYQGKIVSLMDTAGTLAEAFSLAQSILTVNNLILVSTNDMPESVPINTKSYENSGECRLVIGLVQRLIECGIPTTDIGVLAPYSGQVALLGKMLEASWSGIVTSTVDRFQGDLTQINSLRLSIWFIGSEKEVIIISAVRSNNQGKLGFLPNPRRINVAVTRARRLLILVCDVVTLKHNVLLKDLIDHFQQQGVELPPSSILSD